MESQVEIKFARTCAHTCTLDWRGICASTGTSMGTLFGMGDNVGETTEGGDGVSGHLEGE